jgi:hypothetical protein
MNPTAFVDTVYRRRARRRVTMLQGPLTVEKKLDDQGLMERAKIDIGGHELSLRRALLRGKP